MKKIILALLLSLNASADVYLIHGWGGSNSHSMYTLYNPLNAIGVTTHFVDLRNQFDCIDKSVDELHEQIGDSDSILIGHSMGGLVARAYDLKYGHVTKMVLMASPNHGTDIAAFALWSCSAVEMMPGSRFINALNLFPLTVETLGVITLQDAIVSPLSQSMDGIETINVSTGHTEVLQDVDAVNKVVEFVTR